MSTPIHDANLPRDVGTLRASNIGDTPIKVSGWDLDDNDESWSYYEAYKVDLDGHDEPFVMVASNDSPHAVVIPQLGWSYSDSEYDGYVVDLSEHDDTAVPLPEDEWDALFEEDPMVNGAEGPRMNYWYPCEVVEDNPVQAAYILRGTPLCVVEVDGNWGIALTGGGMDLSWDIVLAYVLLGQLPPTHYAGSLRGMPDLGRPDVEHMLIRACLRSLDVAADRLRSAYDQLADSASRWSGGTFK